MSELSAEQTRLAQLWEEHMRHEFQTCSTEDTLATMVGTRNRKFEFTSLRR